MKNLVYKRQKKASIGKVVTAALIGSAVGATVGLLTAPTAGQELRNRIRGRNVGVQERIKTAEGNVESRARELAAEFRETSHDLNPSARRS